MDGYSRSYILVTINRNTYFYLTHRLIKLVVQRITTHNIFIPVDTDCINKGLITDPNKKIATPLKSAHFIHRIIFFKWWLLTSFLGYQQVAVRNPKRT